MILPEKFTVNGQTVRVRLVDTIEGNLFGQYKTVTETIEIAKYIKTEYGMIKPSDYQTINTLFHEVWHCFQAHYKGEFDESEACTVAGFLTELMQSCGVDMKLNDKANDIPEVIEE